MLSDGTLRYKPSPHRIAEQVFRFRRHQERRHQAAEAAHFRIMPRRLVKPASRILRPRIHDPTVLNRSSASPDEIGPGKPLSHRHKAAGWHRPASGAHFVVARRLRSCMAPFDKQKYSAHSKCMRSRIDHVIQMGAVTFVKCRLADRHSMQRGLFGSHGS